MKRLPLTAPTARASCEAVASPKFWTAYEALPVPIRKLADANYALLAIRRCNSRRSDVTGPYASASAIALAAEVDDGYLWFWIGSHADYDKMIG
jgi:hypothetical protein